MDPQVLRSSYRRNKSRGTMAWNSALDLWSLAEWTTVVVVLVLCMNAFAEKPHRQNATLLTVFWLSGRLSDWLKASVFTVLVAFVTSMTNEGSRLGVATGFTAGAGAIALIGVAARALMFSLVEKEALGTRVAIYGYSEGTEDLLEYISSDRGSAVHVVNLFDQRIARGEKWIRGHEVNPNLDELVGLAREGLIDAVILDLPWSAYDRVDELVHTLEQVNVDILMAPSRIQVRTLSRSVGMIGSIPTISLYRRPMSSFEAFSKALIDKTLSVVALFVLSIPLVLITLLIKLESPGPVLFRQIRRGMNNEPFEMLKFRSMYKHAEDKTATTLVTRGDVRVTRVGAILRRLSLDELPQLFNVLSGQMSLVGPRPHVWEAKASDRRYEEVVKRYPARHRMLPGLTGLAQVRGFRGNGDDEIEITNRVKSDLEYIDRWSLGLDIVILARTVAALIFQRAAY
jgi:Undecaprenyl-phosphate glucose phosphotransferase